MSHHDPRERLDDFLDDAASRQRNVKWPDAQRNAASIDKFLWRGSPNPPMVQRVGAWLFGVVFMGLGAAFLSIAREDASWSGNHIAEGSIGLLLFGLGLRVFRNGFPRRWE